MTQFVVALDPVVSGVSAALIAEGVRTPLIKFLHAPNLRTPLTSLSHHTRRMATADRTMEAVLKNGIPTAVVMPKTIIGTPRADPSGPQRAMLAGELTRRLVEEGIALIEIPPMTVLKWALERFVGGQSGHGELEKCVQTTWPGMADPQADKYRWSTVALAAAGCMVVGSPTNVKVTNDRLATLRGAALLPAGWAVPASTTEWASLHGAPLTETGKEKESA